MAWITASGFCVVAALSRYTSGLPCTCCCRIGKSLRICSASKAVRVANAASLIGHLPQLLVGLTEQGSQPWTQVILDGLLRHLVEQLVDETEAQHAHCFRASDTAALQIEDRGFIQLRDRSEERRVGKECRCRWSAYH